MFIQTKRAISSSVLFWSLMVFSLACVPGVSADGGAQPPTEHTDLSERDISGKETEPKMVKTRKTKAEFVPGWFADTADGAFEVGIDDNEKHSGDASGYVRSIRQPATEKFGNLCQWFDADEYRGKHLKMSAWVKTKLESGSAHLWVRVDGDWKSSARRDSFDNMDDRPIKGTTDWQEYSIVVDVPESSTQIFFGGFLFGTGTMWLDDVTIEPVGKDVPVTGKFTSANSLEKRRLQPINLQFDQANKFD